MIEVKCKESKDLTVFTELCEKIPESFSWQSLDYDHDNKIISIGVEDFDDIISNLETLENYIEDPEILDNVSDEFLPLHVV